MLFFRMSALAAIAFCCALPSRAEEEARGERLTIKDAIALAREANLDVRLARERLLEAIAAVKAERAALLPTLDGSVQQTRQERALGAYGLPESATVTIPDPIEGTISYNVPNSVVDRFNLPTKTTVEFPDPFEANIDYSKTTRTYDWFNARLRLNVPLVNVQNFREYKAKTAAEARAQRELVMAEEKAVNSTAAAFLKVLLHDVSIETLRQRLDLQEKRVSYMEDQQHSGLATELEVLREKQALVSVRADYRAAQGNRTQAIRELTALIGWEEASQPAPDGSLDYPEWNFPSVEAALELAFKTRADLLAQLDRERTVRLQRDAARADFYPTLSAMGSYGREGDRYSDTVDTWLIGAILSVPIWDSFGRQGRLEQRASQLAQTENRTEALRVSIANEVRGTLDALELTKDALELGRGGVKLAEENLRFRKDQEAAGVAGPMEVNSAEMELAKARYKRAETLYNFNYASLMFWTAVGDAEKYLNPPLSEPEPATESTTTPEPSQTE